MQTTKTIGIVKVALVALFLLAGTSFFVPTAFAQEDDGGGWSSTEDSGGWSSTPDSGGWTAASDIGGWTSTPDTGWSSTPIDGGWTSTPDAGGWTATPDTGWTATPDTGWTAVPDSGAWTATPDVGWTATPAYSSTGSYDYGTYSGYSYGGGSSYSGGTYYPSTTYGSRTYYPTTYYPTTYTPTTHTTPTPSTNNYCVNNSCNTTISNNPGAQTQVVYTSGYVQPYVSSYVTTQPYVAVGQYVPNGNPYVTLSAVPYTGLDLGPYGTVIYWSLLILFSLFAAYLLIVVRVQNKLFRWLNTFLFGSGEVAAVVVANTPVEQAPAVQYKPVVSAPADYTDTFVLSQIRRANA